MLVPGNQAKGRTALRLDDPLTILIIIGLLAATVAIGAPLAIATVLIVSWLLQKPRQGWWLMSVSRALKALKAQVRSQVGHWGSP